MKSRQKNQRGASIAILASVSLILASCGEESPAKSSTPDAPSTTSANPTSTTAAEPAKPSDLKDLAVKPIIEEPSGDPPTELVTEDVVVGAGAAAESGSTIVVDYVGTSWSTGKEFDSSWDRGSTFELALGAGSVIPGWEQGLVGMKVGGRRKITIPPALGYGEKGAGADIGPNETLVFVVDLRFAATKPTVDPASLAPATELSTVDLVPGTGPALEATSSAKVHYVGYAVSTKKEFDASWGGADGAFGVTLGAGQVIPGWEQGLVGMKVGGRRQITIPPALAYGATGAGNGAIAPNETLVFVVDLISIQAAPAG